jgi:hypothetical protein
MRWWRERGSVCLFTLYAVPAGDTRQALEPTAATGAGKHSRAEYEKFAPRSTRKV